MSSPTVPARTVTIPLVAAASTLMIAAAVVAAGPCVAGGTPGPARSAELSDGRFEAVAVLSASAPAGKLADATSGAVRGRAWSRIGDFDLRKLPPGAFGDEPPVDTEAAGN